MEVPLNEPLHEYWHEYMPEEITQLKKKYCKGCKFLQALDGVGNTASSGYCARILETKKRNPYRPETCPYYEKR